MRIETCRILADWLLQPEPIGINHWIPLVPRDAGDAQPPLIAPFTSADYAATLAVFDETRHPWVTEKQESPASPAIYIMTEGEFDLAGEATPNGQVRKSEQPIVVVARYLNAQQDITTALRHGEYTLRAMMRAFRELMTNQNASYRDRNGIQIETIESAIYMPVIETVGNAQVAGAVVLNLNMRDVNNTF
jgi:hypothetical protein